MWINGPKVYTGLADLDYSVLRPPVESPRRHRINELRETKRALIQTASAMLDAAEASGGFNEETRRAYYHHKIKILENKKLLVEAGFTS